VAVATWNDVERLGLALPQTQLGAAHSGEPAVWVQTKQFARSRHHDAKGAVLQFWVADADLVDAYAHSDPQTFWGARGYSRIVVMASLALLSEADLGEILAESWRCRAGATLRKAHPNV
jgi:hypothetical protein